MSLRGKAGKEMNICPVCGGSESSVAARAGAYEMLNCANCGLGYSEPMRAAPSSRYNVTDYFARWEFARFIGRIPGKGRKLLDVGCGKGIFLKMAERVGYDVYGVDFNGPALKTARQKLPAVMIEEGKAEDFLKRHPELRFDAITAFHVLEHLEDPAGFLISSARHLTRGGMLAVSVPNPLRWQLKYGTEEWDVPPHHLTRWNFNSLNTVFDKAGLKIVFSSAETGFGNDLAYVHAVLNRSWGILSKFKRTPVYNLSQKTGTAGVSGVIGKAAGIKRKLMYIPAVPAVLIAKMTGWHAPGGVSLYVEAVKR